MTPRRNNKLKLAAYAGALVFSALVWFGVVVLGRAMLADRDAETAARSTTRNLPAASTTHPELDNREPAPLRTP